MPVPIRLPRSRWSLTGTASAAAVLAVGVLLSAAGPSTAAELTRSDYVHVYTNNVENLKTLTDNCRGDWQDLVFAMKRTDPVPDIFLVQQITDREQLTLLVSTLEAKLNRKYTGRIANPSPPVQPARCEGDKKQQTTAIIFDTDRFNVLQADTWMADRDGDNGCVNTSQSRAEALRLKLHDTLANKDLTVASTHWPTSNSGGHPCIAENAREASEKVSGWGGDLMIWGGDANTTAGTPGDWKAWYQQTNGDLGGGAGFRDVMFDHCGKVTAPRGECLGNNWTIGGSNRIDYIWAKKPNGMPATSAVHTVTFEEAGQADAFYTGSDNPANYSDHRAVRALIHY